MVEVKLNPKHGTTADRINNRLRNSGEGAGDPSHTVKHGTGPTRAFTNIHHTAGHTSPAQWKSACSTG